MTPPRYIRRYLDYVAEHGSPALDSLRDALDATPRTRTELAARAMVSRAFAELGLEALVGLGDARRAGWTERRGSTPPARLYVRAAP